MPSVARPRCEPDTPDATVMRRVAIAMRDIKLAHSVFALPFAVLGAFLAAPRHEKHGHVLLGRFAGVLALVVACMFLARTWAMLINRVADARLDAANPRTARRAFASGALSRRDGVVLLGASAAGFMGCCAAFRTIFDNPWPLTLAPPVLVWIAFYSFTKRFTWLCHVFLGGALAASPIAAAIAAGGAEPFRPMTTDGVAVLWLSGMVVCWVAGFDVIYALQDLDFDRGAGLHSIPARFGRRGSAWISRTLHAGALACLVGAWRATPRFGAVFAGAIVLVAGVLALEHAVLARRGDRGIPMAFFTLNGVVSCVLGLAGVVEIVLRDFQ